MIKKREGLTTFCCYCCWFFFLCSAVSFAKNIKPCCLTTECFFLCFHGGICQILSILSSLVDRCYPKIWRIYLSFYWFFIFHFNSVGCEGKKGWSKWFVTHILKFQVVGSPCFRRDNVFIQCCTQWKDESPEQLPKEMLWFNCQSSHSAFFYRVDSWVLQSNSEQLPFGLFIF